MMLLIRDKDERNHVNHMNYLGFKFGQFIHLSEKELHKLSSSIILHDIGKVAISRKLLDKEYRLYEKEYELVKSHPKIAYWFIKTLHLSEDIALAVLHHHEQWNGKGYPYQLYETKIPYLSRIIALIDSYEAMADHRPYKTLLSKEQIIIEIKREAGEQFDPILARDFINFLIINNYPCFRDNRRYPLSL